MASSCYAASASSPGVCYAPAPKKGSGGCYSGLSNGGSSGGGSNNKQFPTINSGNLTEGKVITVTSIIDNFIENVTNVVINGALHSSNNKRSPYTNNYVVPPSILGSVNAIPKPVPGSQGSTIDANTLYSALIKVTRYLLRVGTYHYSESKSVTGNWPHGAPSTNHWSSSGKALFSDQYAAGQIGNLSTATISPTVTQSPNLSTYIISASELRELIERCYSSWSSSHRPNYDNGHYVYCHASCHSNCHKSCHGSCQDSDNCNSDGSPCVDCYGNDHGDGCQACHSKCHDGWGGCHSSACN